VLLAELKRIASSPVPAAAFAGDFNFLAGTAAVLSSVFR
jgi:hypothetical protein